MARSTHSWFEKLPWQKAEAILGRRINRRRKYFTRTLQGDFAAIAEDNSFAGQPSDVVFTYGEWVKPCSGCTCAGEYPCDCCAVRGTGCRECGYTGKIRQGMHAPYNMEHDD